MTDQPEKDLWSNESQDFPMPRGRSGGDSTLISLEAVVNVTQGSIGVLLVMPGGLLRGLLVSSAQWHSEWFASIAEAGEAGASAHAILKGLFGTTGHLTSEGEMIDHTEHYLYIKDGYFTAGAGEQGPMPWKVKLSSIVAWSIGNRPPA
ncbi:hypothetical protein ACFMQL_12840 [Nonomuraea fastidiosa]|jgi:hypothetical protein|uniref:hypothetical protein n=1 Tax=Nonomuraea TaxID=83681 RepID=UPI00366DE7F6